MFNQIKNRGAAKRAEDRAKKVRIALDDEMARFNAAIELGKKAYIETFAGKYEVRFVTSDFWYVTGGGLDQRSWAGCNDGTWANLLRQVNEPRSPLFED